MCVSLLTGSRLDLAARFCYHKGLKLGLLISGEKDHGIELKIISKAIVYQIASILNFCVSVDCFLAFADTVLIMPMPINIMVMCSMPKNLMARSCIAVLKLCKK